MPVVCLKRACVCLLVLAGACKAYDATLIDAPETSANASAAPRDPACATRTDRCNGEDDDCDGIIDEEGSTSCNIPHAQARCLGGACVFEACEQGYFNCNLTATDGCEKSAEEVSCGECGLQCDAAVGRGPGGAGANRDASRPETQEDAGYAADDDAGTCADQTERCDGIDNDCDSRIDEDNACSCQNSKPSGQGAACDRCVCEQCEDSLSLCQRSNDENWSRRCTALMQCYGQNLGTDRCSNGDCYRGGDGPCATQTREASTFPNCGTTPVFAPCGAFAVVRKCFADQCNSVCKH
jgi:hypothetical protein